MRSSAWEECGRASFWRAGGEQIGTRVVSMVEDRPLLTMEELMVANRVLSPLFLRASVLTLLAASAVACKSSSSGPSESDAGKDSAVTADGGSQADSGAASDSSAHADSGAADSATASDSGSGTGTEGRAQGLFDWVEVVFSLVEGAAGSGAGAVV
jgi:hypothetical protein